MPLSSSPSDDHGKMYGFLQVDKAFEYLESSAEVDRPDVRYQVTARRSDSTATNRGILLRDTVESAQPRTFICEVSPQLHEVRQ